jgi:hypothetical protein
MMTDDHVFIDADCNVVSGKEACMRALTGFFQSFPDYRNVFEQVALSRDVVLAVGHSVCSDARLAGPALWTATITGGLVSRWRVYEDTATNRASLGFAD